jgi:hypothetical protein
MLRVGMQPRRSSVTSDDFQLIAFYHIDKDWSLTDCMSISLANQLNIRQIFTSDHHFTQAGFEILLST